MKKTLCFMVVTEPETVKLEVEHVEYDPTIGDILPTAFEGLIDEQE